jgi:hypothetical protein
MLKFLGIVIVFVITGLTLSGVDSTEVGFPLLMVGGVVCLVGSGYFLSKGIREKGTRQSTEPQVENGLLARNKCLLTRKEQLLPRRTPLHEELEELAYQITAHDYSSHDVEVPTPTLDIHINGWEFKTSGHRDFPQTPKGMWMRVHAGFNMSTTILLERVSLDIAGERLEPSEWTSIRGEGYYHQYHYLLVPKSIIPGPHLAKLIVLADGRWIGSPGFGVIVPEQ